MRAIAGELHPLPPPSASCPVSFASHCAGHSGTTEALRLAKHPCSHHCRSEGRPLCRVHLHERACESPDRRIGDRRVQSVVVGHHHVRRVRVSGSGRPQLVHQFSITCSTRRPALLNALLSCPTTFKVGAHLGEDLHISQISSDFPSASINRALTSSVTTVIFDSRKQLHFDPQPPVLRVALQLDDRCDPSFIKRSRRRTGSFTSSSRVTAEEASYIPHM